MMQKRKLRRWIWLLLLPVLGIAIWWRPQPPGFRQVRQYPSSGSPVTALPSGFLLWGGVDIANMTESASFRDWDNHERWCVTQPHRMMPKSWAITPDGREFAWSDYPWRPVVTVWRDGREIRHTGIGTPEEDCTWLDVRKDGTTWAATFTCQDNVMHLYAIRADRVLRGEVHLPKILPGSAERVAYGGNVLANIPECTLTPDATTFRVTACVDKAPSKDVGKNDDEEGSRFYYPAFLTCRLRATSDHLELLPVARDTTTASEMPDRWHDRILAGPSACRITGASGAPWVIPGAKPEKYNSDYDQTPDGRYALIARMQAGDPGAGPVQQFRDWLSHFVPAQSYLICDLYERPGILRAHARILLPKTGKHVLDFHAVHLATDGHAAVVTVSLDPGGGIEHITGENMYIVKR